MLHIAQATLDTRVQRLTAALSGTTAMLVEDVVARACAGVRGRWERDWVAGVAGVRAGGEDAAVQPSPVAGVPVRRPAPE